MSELNNHIGNMSVEELRNWLFNFLRDRRHCKPDLSFPVSHVYRTKSDYLASLIRKETNANLIIKLSQAVETLLDEHLPSSSHLSKIFNTFYETSIFSDLLYIYEILPSADYQILPKISIALENYFEKYSGKQLSGKIKLNFHCQIEEENIRRMFFVMASKVNVIPTVIKKKTIHAGTYMILEEFYLKTIEFVVPAFCLLARINLKKAIEHLPDTLNFITKQHDDAYGGLLLDLTGIVNDNIEIWKKIKNTLPDDEKIKDVLRVSIDCWDIPNKHEIIKLFTDSGSE